MEITWETDMEAALERAKSEKKPILLEFFNPACIGCKQMEAVTYPVEKVQEFISTSLVPLKIRADAQPYAKDFNVKWTPTFVVLDGEGREHSRAVGFLPPEELVPFLLLGMAKVFFDADLVSEALPLLERLREAYPGSGAAPEAVFLHGVASFKVSLDPKPLKAAYETLAREYPGSEWVKRAAPYQLL